MLPRLLSILPFYVCLFWASLLLFNIRKNSRPQNSWILVMIALAITTFCRIQQWPAAELYAISIYYILLFFYLRAVIRYRRRLEEYYSNLDRIFPDHIYYILVYALLMGVCFLIQTYWAMAVMGVVNFFMGYKVYYHARDGT